MQAERSLLGAMLNTPTAADAAVAIVDKNDFYSVVHGLVFDAIVAVYEGGHRPDPVTVEAELIRRGKIDDVGGRKALVDLQVAGVDTGAAPRYASIIREHAVLRSAIGHAHDISEAAYAFEPNAALKSTEALLQLLDQAVMHRGPQPADKVADEWIAELEARTRGERPGIPTGFYDLDRAIGGMRPGQLIVVAGRTGMGKTAFAGSLALNAAADGHDTLVCSVEMARVELTDRYMSALSRVDHTFLRDGVISPRDWELIDQALGQLVHMPLWIDDRAELTVTQIRGAARSIPGLKVLVVDYLQLLKTAGRDNRATEVADISGALKNLARRLEIPIVALAQLNRDTERRTDKRPQLIDLRESGSIENDADVVIGLYRDEYYNPNTDDGGVLEAIVLKQRAGPQTTVRLGFDATHSAVVNLARQEEL